MRSRGWMVGVGVVACGLTGCADIVTTSDSLGGGDGTTSDADRHLAEMAGLQLSDFPSGWQETADATDSSDDFADSDACQSIGSAADLAEGRAVVDESGDFARGTSEASSAVIVFEDEERAERAFALFDDPEVTTCFEDAMREGYQEDLDADPESALELLDVTADQGTTFDFGDEDVTYQIAVRVNADGLGVTVYMDYDVIRVGRALTTVMFLDAFDEFDEDLREQLLAAVSERLGQTTGIA